MYTSLALDAKKDDTPKNTIYLSDPENNNEDNIHQRWRFVLVVGGYRIIHNQTKLALDANNFDEQVYLSAPENNNEGNPYQKWWFR